MKKIILMSLLFLVSCNSRRQNLEIIIIEKVVMSEWNMFIKALIHVESEGDPYAVGKDNDVGILQITPIYVKEVNRILGKDVYPLNCRTNVKKSLEMFEIYQNHYNPNRDINKAIKLHNPRADQSYKVKVLEKLKQLKSLNI